MTGTTNWFLARPGTLFHSARQGHAGQRPADTNRMKRNETGRHGPKDDSTKIVLAKSQQFADKKAGNPAG
jgi:hypothetical protein